METEEKIYYYITYKNQGKSERVSERSGTRAEAEEIADFLRFQGAKSVRVHVLGSY